MRGAVRPAVNTQSQTAELRETRDAQIAWSPAQGQRVQGHDDGREPRGLSATHKTLFQLQVVRRIELEPAGRIAELYQTRET